jgi:UDP-N-acetyl-D-glucosamine dehydrogenase
MKSIKFTKGNVSKYDAVVVSTDHTCYDYGWLHKNAKLIIDTRNAVKAGLTDRKVVKA